MPAIPDPTSLRQVNLFRDVALPELAVLNGLMRQQLFPAGVRMMMLGQLEDTTYVIRKGAVKAVVEQDGTEVILEILGPGDVIGAVTLGHCPGGACSIVSLDETTLFWIDRAAFGRCLQEMPTLNSNMLALLARRVRLAHERIEALAGMDVRGRIVRHLLLLAREYGAAVEGGGIDAVRIPLRLTQFDLATLVGASRVRVNQALSELRRRALVDTCSDHTLVIRDVAALEKLR